MKTLVGLIAVCFVVAAATAADIESAPIFQMRLVANMPTVTSEPMVMVSKSDHRALTNTFNVEKKVLMDQTALRSARVKTDSLGHPVIEITFTENGTEQFATVTGQNVGKQLAIIIDGRLSSTPFIRTAIPSGKAQITGSFSKEEAADLARRINAALKK